MYSFSKSALREDILQSTRWLVRQPGVLATTRLYCFSYAGGNARSYLPWQAGLGGGIEVCAIELPGRGARFGERLYQAMPTLIADLNQVIAQSDDIPFAFFGHSLGALVAFELARHRQRSGGPLPHHLFVSGCAAPQHRNPSRGLHRLPAAELIDVLRQYQGTPPEVLMHGELMALLLPTIRADFALAEEYEYHPSPPLSVPLTVLTGKSDERVSLAQAQGWAKETVLPCAVQLFEGGHFFIHDEMPEVLKCIRSQLDLMQVA